MKKIGNLLCFVLVMLSLSACETTKKSHVVAPSTVGVKGKVTQAAGSVDDANKASERSSEHIRNFKSRSELIDYKATRALKFFN